MPCWFVRVRSTRVAYISRATSRGAGGGDSCRPRESFVAGPPPPNPPENRRATTKRYTAGTSYSRARAPPPTGIRHVPVVVSSIVTRHSRIILCLLSLLLFVVVVCLQGWRVPRARTYRQQHPSSLYGHRHRQPCQRARVHTRNVILYTLAFVRDRSGRGRVFNKISRRHKKTSCDSCGRQ